MLEELAARRDAAAVRPDQCRAQRTPIRIEQRGAMHLACQADRRDLTVHYLGPCGQSAQGRARRRPPIVRVLFGPPWPRLQEWIASALDAEHVPRAGHGERFQAAGPQVEAEIDMAWARPRAAPLLRPQEPFLP